MEVLGRPGSSPPKSPKEALCGYGFTKDLKDSLNALAADRSAEKRLNKSLDSERCWSCSPQSSMNCLQLSSSVLQMTNSMCNKACAAGVDDSSSCRHLLLGSSNSTGLSTLPSASSSGYALPFCMDDDDQDGALPPEAALTFHLPNGGTQQVVVEENLRCIDLCHLLTLKLNVARSPTWTIVERIADLKIERSLEDHEEVLQVYASWGKNKEESENKFYFRQDFRKYEFFHSPLQFFSLDMVDFGSQLDCLAESTDHAKLVTLQNLLNQGEKCPVVHSQLWFLEPGKVTWKRSFFCVENSSLSTCPTGTKDSWQLQPVADLSQWNIYVPLDKNPSGPTKYQFCLRPTRPGGSSSVDLMWFCTDTEQQRQCWIIALRLAKFGKKLRENYKEVKSRYSEQSWSGESRAQVPSPWVAMDFTGSKGRVINDPLEAEAVAAAEAHSWKRKLPCCRPGHVSPTGTMGQSPGSGGFQHPGRPHVVQDLGIEHTQPWFYSGMLREEATQLLLRHGTVDGVFLVRQSFSKPGNFVLCYAYRGKVHHVQIIAVEEKDQLCYSLDGGRTKFYDLLQLVEFYQLNLSYLPTKLTHFLVHHQKRKDSPPSSAPPTLT